MNSELLPRQPLLTEAETQTLLLKARKGDKQAREKLASGHLRLVYKVAQRFMNRGREIEDLFQVGAIGLIKAIDKFDPEFGVCFSTYAVPMIMGEIRRYLRDDNIIHISRSIKESAQRVLQIKEELSQKLGREANLTEIAEASGLGREEIILALDCLAEPLSLQGQAFSDEQGPTLEENIKDNATDANWVERLAIQEAIANLKDKERKVIELRFFQAKTQFETAEEIGISQAQVSRLEKGALHKIKKLI